MRSTLDVIIALKESQPVTEDELRFALLALSNIDYFIKRSLGDLVEAVEADKASAKLKAAFAKGTRERMFQAMKQDPQVWLGPGNTPGTPEYAERYALAQKVAKAAGVL